MRNIQQQANMWVEPVQVQRGDIWTLGKHRLMCGDSTSGEDVARLLQGEHMDLIFADPPYGIGIDTWDVKIEDVSAFIELVTSHLKQVGFFAFTHQMPFMVEWLHVLETSKLRYKDQIAWVKRIVNAIAQPLTRAYENLFIYAYGKASYHQCKGRYEDVKLPGVLVDVIALEGIDRHIKDLRLKAKGIETSVRDVGDNHISSYDYMPRISDRSPEFTSFTNVWSFLPEHHSSKNVSANRHATAKPILLMNRLIELCTPDNSLVYDAFLGSGTTLISAEHTGRTCYGMELSPEYCESIIQRWQEHTGIQAVKLCL